MTVQGDGAGNSPVVSPLRFPCPRKCFVRYKRHGSLWVGAGEVVIFTAPRPPHWAQHWRRCLRQGGMCGICPPLLGGQFSRLGEGRRLLPWRRGLDRNLFQPPALRRRGHLLDRRQTLRSACPAFPRPVPAVAPCCAGGHDSRRDAEAPERVGWSRSSCRGLCPPINTRHMSSNNNSRLASVIPCAEVAAAGFGLRFWGFFIALHSCYVAALLAIPTCYHVAKDRIRAPRV
jgi:hypothetical protein